MDPARGSVGKMQLITRHIRSLAALLEKGRTREVNAFLRQTLAVVSGEHFDFL